jgi:sterol desaturase/sphingolipid hydroxylase (fatty acid hydroxylase superfamily)
MIGMDVVILAIYESILIVSILFHHCNIFLPQKIDAILRIFIVTPDMHRTHHSINPSEINSNYSSITSIWDRIFNTFTRWGNTKNLTLGLNIFREEKWQTPWGILAVPFMEKNSGGKYGEK